MQDVTPHLTTPEADGPTWNDIRPNQDSAPLLVLLEGGRGVNELISCAQQAEGDTVT